jgi:hypothetical protein
MSSSLRDVVGQDGRKEVLGEEDADHVVDRLAVHGDARVLRAAHAVHHLRPRRLPVEPHHVDARDHEFVHFGLAQAKDAVEEPAFLLGDLRFRRHDLHELLGGRLAFLIGVMRWRHEPVQRRVDPPAEAAIG